MGGRCFSNPSEGFPALFFFLFSLLCSFFCLRKRFFIPLKTLNSGLMMISVWFFLLRADCRYAQSESQPRFWDAGAPADEQFRSGWREVASPRREEQQQSKKMWRIKVFFYTRFCSSHSLGDLSPLFPPPNLKEVRFTLDRCSSAIVMETEGVDSWAMTEDRSSCEIRGVTPNRDK